MIRRSMCAVAVAVTLSAAIAAAGIVAATAQAKPAELTWHSYRASASLCIGVDDSGRPMASAHPAIAKSWVSECWPRAAKWGS